MLAVFFLQHFANTVEPPLTATSTQHSPLFNDHISLSQLLIQSLKSSYWEPPHNGHLFTMARKFGSKVAVVERFDCSLQWMNGLIWKANTSTNLQWAPLISSRIQSPSSSPAAHAGVFLWVQLSFAVEIVGKKKNSPYSNQYEARINKITHKAIL